MGTSGYFWLRTDTFGREQVLKGTRGYFSVLFGVCCYFWASTDTFRFVQVLLSALKLLGACGYFRVRIGTFVHLRVILSAGIFGPTQGSFGMHRYF